MTATQPQPPAGAKAAPGCGHTAADHRAIVRELLARHEPEYAATLPEAVAERCPRRPR